MITAEDIESKDRAIGELNSPDTEDLREVHRKVCETIEADFDAVNNYTIHVVKKINNVFRMNNQAKFIIGFAIRQAFAVGVLVGKSQKENTQ